MKKQKNIVSSVLSKRKRALWRIRLYAALAVVLLLMVGVFFISRAQFWTITDVRVEGTKVLLADEISEYVWNDLAGTYFYLIPRKNAALFPREVVRRSLKQKFPGIDSIDIKLANLKVVDISITERVAESLWCADFEKECFYMDDTGLIFDRAPVFSDGVYSKFGGGIQETDPLGLHYLDGGDFGTLKKTIDGLKKSGISVLRAMFVGNGDVDLNIPGGKVLVNLRQHPDVIVKNLELVLQSQKFKADAGTPPQFKYIDLRFGNKIYYSIK